ncbi:MAG TPA: hypothetical protein VGK99_23645 [Acidobacteriota bacterium]|jgi:hypothetical protein
MRKLRLIPLVLAAVLSGAPLWSQSLLPHKDLSFAQVAIGDYRTVINVTNRGRTAYNGTLYFNKNQGEIWNVVVNGQLTTDGKLTVNLQPGATVTYTVTGPVTEAGYAYLIAADLGSNFVEGNLTYFLQSGATVVDSVGVSPSSEFFLTSIPFEDFTTIALALANLDLDKRTAIVRLTLLNESGNEISRIDDNLGYFWHKARFLREIFPVTIGRGKIEISSDVPIIGTALTLVQGQLSSLPIVPSPRTYSATLSGVDGKVSRGELSIWSEGNFVKGYLRITESGGQSIDPETYLVYGRLVSGALRLSFYGRGRTFQEQEAIVYARFLNFTFTNNAFSGSYVTTLLANNLTTTGTFSLTRLN